jgi:hypothetical protein
VSRAAAAAARVSRAATATALVVGVLYGEHVRGRINIVRSDDRAQPRTSFDDRAASQIAVGGQEVAWGASVAIA